MPRRAAPLDARERRAFIDASSRRRRVFASLVTRLVDDRSSTRRIGPGGWTIRQVVHHVPDSHMNAYIRMKLAVTEDAPAIETYEESRWAELPEAKQAPIEMSLALLDALHTRWVAFLRALPAPAFRKVVRRIRNGDA